MILDEAISDTLGRCLMFLSTQWSVVVFDVFHHHDLSPKVFSPKVFSAIAEDVSNQESTEFLAQILYSSFRCPVPAASPAPKFCNQSFAWNISLNISEFFHFLSPLQVIKARVLRERLTKPTVTDFSALKLQ